MKKLFFFFTKREKSLFEIIPVRLLLVNWIFRKVFHTTGVADFSIHFTSNIWLASRIVFDGDPTSMLKSFAVSGGCHFAVHEGATLEIGEGTIWAYNVSIQTANHDFIDRDKYITESIKIGRNCWIGSSVTILPGVVLGDNVTVGANAVVTKSFPPNVVIAGVPARVIKSL